MSSLNPIWGIILLILIFLIGYGVMLFISNPLPSKPVVGSSVDVFLCDIEPPHNGMDAKALKAAYVEAEDAIVAAHPLIMAPNIRQSMATCLMQGWPVDVAISQSCHTFSRGVCQCETCRYLVKLQ